MSAWTWALAILLGYYVFFVLRVAFGLSRLRRFERSASHPRVSVIVAARNEERVIGSCITSILAQDYPPESLQVIVVDDASKDQTASIVQKIRESRSRVSLVALPERPADGIGGKPEAIRAGIERADGEIVITTDADCTHPPTWVRTMVSYFSSSTAMVAGPVSLSSGPSLFARVERLDFLGLVISGAGLIGAGRPIICNGANLAYRRVVYLRAAADVQRSSNDDGTLMSRIVSRGLGDVTFAHHADALVTTEGQGDLAGFFRQRRRWAAVRGRFLDPTIYLELALLFAFFVVVLVATAMVAFNPTLGFPVLIAWGVKAVVDLIPLLSATKVWGLDRGWFEILLAELFHPFSIVIATVLSVAAPFRWKERTLVR